MTVQSSYGSFLNTTPRKQHATSPLTMTMNISTLSSVPSRMPSPVPPASSAITSPTIRTFDNQSEPSYTGGAIESVVTPSVSNQESTALSGQGDPYPWASAVYRHEIPTGSLAVRRPEDNVPSSTVPHPDLPLSATLSTTAITIPSDPTSDPSGGATLKERNNAANLLLASKYACEDAKAEIEETAGGTVPWSEVASATTRMVGHDYVVNCQKSPGNRQADNPLKVVKNAMGLP